MADDTPTDAPSPTDHPGPLDGANPEVSQKSDDQRMHEFRSRHRVWPGRFPLLIVMVIFAMICIAVAQSNWLEDWLLWLVLTPFYAAVGLWLTWQQSVIDDKPFLPSARNQLLHWLGVMIGLKILAFLQAMNFLDSASLPDVSIIVLALGCYTAGIHFEWMFLVLGVILFIMSLLLAIIELDIFLILLITAGVAAICIAVAWVILRRRQNAKVLEEAKPDPAD